MLQSRRRAFLRQQEEERVQITQNKHSIWNHQRMNKETEKFILLLVYVYILLGE